MSNKDPGAVTIYDPQDSSSVLADLGRTGTSRRNFIKGIIAAGATVSAGSMLPAMSSYAQSAAAGTVERLISLNINGTVRRVDVLPQETLAMTLRYKLGLTGTKFGCDRGECGACTVLIDDVANYSCSTLTHTMRGRKITTIEGLQAANGDLHPVQQAFVDELGPQCGFCTPGFLVAAKSLLERNPDPTETEIRFWLAGNLCRCTGYDKIVRAVLDTAVEMQES